jgi:hypothetical protein
VTVTRRNGAIRTKHDQAPGDSHLLAPFSGRTRQEPRIDRKRRIGCQVTSIRDFLKIRGSH